MVSVESHPFSSCAIASTDMTADWACSGGYFAISRSMRFRASELSMIDRPASPRMSGLRGPSRRYRAWMRSRLVRPIVHVVAGAGHVPQTAAEGAHLLRIRVFAHLRRHHGADGKVGEFGVRVVDDLVRGFRAADRAADHVARANAAHLAAVAQRARALHDEEHLLFATVAVKRARALAGRDDIVRITEVLRTDERADANGIALELVALREMLELQFVDVDDSGIDHAHRSISPKTMSCVPMIATTSAIMCPRVISSIAARCANPAARNLRRYGLLAPSVMM